MARITPSNGEIPNLEDHEAYGGTLREISWDTSSPEYGSERRLVCDWQVGIDANDTIRDWVGLRLGVSKTSGQVSKLRQMLNAIAERPPTTEIAWFDDETTEWSYDDAPFARLEPGMQVLIRGENVVKSDGGKRFRINVYQAHTPRQATSTASARRPRQAVEQAAKDEMPF